MSGRRAATPRFGIVELLWTTVASSTIAMIIAVPFGVVALFITQYAPSWLKRPAASLVDLLAAVPSIVYGLWAALTFRSLITPVEGGLQDVLGWFPLFSSTGISGGTIFFIGIVLSIMVLPIVTALSREVFDQTPVTQGGRPRIGRHPLGDDPDRRSALRQAGRHLGLHAGAGARAGRDDRGDLPRLQACRRNPVDVVCVQRRRDLRVANRQQRRRVRHAAKTGAYIAAGLVLFVLTFVVNAIARIVIERRKAFSE